MHLVIHSQYYPPEIGAPQTRLHELALILKEKGVDVTVLTALPNYPHGQIYAEYSGRWLCVEDLDGIKVIRTPIYPSQSAGLVSRLFNYFSFAFFSLVIGIWKVGRADFLITESPPIFLGITGLILSRLKGAKWIFNISDLWPKSAVELGVISSTSWAYKLSSALEKFLYAQAWLITGQSRTILANINERLPGKRTYHLSNGVDTRFFYPRAKAMSDQKFHIVYAGLHGLAQGLSQIILAAQKISENGSIDFTFIGDGPEKMQLIQLATDLNLDKVRFLPPVAKEKIVDILNDADVLLVPLKIQLTGAVPSKLYEAMAIGKPVILIAMSEAAEIVTASECGLIVQPGDIDGIVESINYLKSNPEKALQMGINGRQAVCQSFDRCTIVERFSKYLVDEIEKAA